MSTTQSGPEPHMSGDARRRAPVERPHAGRPRSRYGWLFAGLLLLGLAWLKSCALVDVAPRHHPLLLHRDAGRQASPMALGGPGIADRH